MVLYTEWKNNISHTFYDAYLAATDYGVCCFIQPHLDFENAKTVNLPPAQYTPEDYHAVPKGAKNGLQNGLKLMLDVEGLRELNNDRTGTLHFELYKAWPTLCIFSRWEWSPNKGWQICILMASAMHNKIKGIEFGST